MKLSGKKDSVKYEKVNEKLAEIKNEVDKVMVGQKEVIDQVLTSILCDGNILLESNPGMGKTKMASTISKTLGLEFSRIQSTPDLMPSDITGTHIVDESSGKAEFIFQQGPIFANMVLTDEINRATPKTQSALLEAMQEKQVTVGNNSYSLDRPFFLIATQNPIEQEGTYPLPEAQRDRFMMKVKLDFPNSDEEDKIVERFTQELDYDPELEKVVSKQALIKLQEFTREVPIADDIRKSAVQIVRATREKEELKYGASPRASINLVLASKGRALVENRNHVSMKDVKNMAKPVLRHRIGLSFSAEKKGLNPDDVIEEIVEEL